MGGSGQDMAQVAWGTFARATCPHLRLPEDKPGLSSMLNQAKERGDTLPLTLALVSLLWGWVWLALLATELPNIWAKSVDR